MFGRVLSWATTILEQQSAICLRLDDFMAEMRKVFDSLVSRREAAQKLLQLRQDIRSVEDYVVDFRTLEAESACNPESLHDTFLHGLPEEIKDELAARELPMDIAYLIALTIWIDGRLQECRRKRRCVLGHTCSSSFSLASEEPRKYPMPVFSRESNVTEFPGESSGTSDSSPPAPMQLGRA